MAPTQTRTTSTPNREKARKNKWSKYPAYHTTEPTEPKPNLEQIDIAGTYGKGRDLYSMREIRNERFRRGIAWDEPG